MQEDLPECSRSSPADFSMHDRAEVLDAIDRTMLILEFDRAGKITGANDTFLRRMGYRLEEICGRAHDTLCPPQVGAVGREASIWASLQKGDAFSRIVRRARQDGTEVWLDAFYTPIMSARGELERVIKIANDVTDDVRRRESVRRVLKGVDEAGNAVVISSPDDRVLYANEGFKRLLEKQGESVRGRMLRELIGAARMEPATTRYLSNRLSKPPGQQQELLLYGKSGRPIWVAATTNAVFDEHGNVANIVDVLTDITPTKIYEVLQRRILRAVFDDQPIEEVMALLCAELTQLAPELQPAVARLDDDRQWQALAAPALPPQHLDALRLFDPAVIADAAADGNACQALTAIDPAQDAQWAPQREWLDAAALTGCAARAIVTAAGRTIGLLAFFFRDRAQPDDFHRRLMDVGLHLCSLALEREDVRARLQQLAYYDDLTGLPNRSHLHAEAERAVDDMIRRDGTLAVLVIDIDRFKQVNEQFGHSAGDALLREVARRLRAVLRSGDIVGRMSGDEFLVVLPQCDVKGIEIVTRHLTAELTRPLDVGATVLRPTASVGVSFFPDNGQDLPALLRHADMAMVQAKTDGRACVRFFSPEMNQMSQERHALEGALRHALENEGLQLHYQPQIRMRDGVLYGVEALARWRHPALGELSPARFVPLAEACGLIGALGEWAIRTACRQLADWRARGVAVPTVSVNLSPTNFHRVDLEATIEAALRRYRLTPSDLTLEITESVLLDSNPDTMNTIARLTTSGVRLSMDDFGTGYSSLGHLRRLSVHELKLDRSFVVGIESDAPSRALASAIVRIGESLNLKVVAEGVETEVQRHFLAELGCDAVQGFLYSPALPAAELERWLAQRSPAA